KRPFWDQYVCQSPHGLPLHLSGWQDVMVQTYGYETRYLTAVSQDRIVGVLPLFFVCSPLVGSVVRTMPGGLCADSDAAAQALLAAGQAWAQQKRAKRFWLADSRICRPGDLQTTTAHVHWTLGVRGDEKTLWQQLDGNIRRQVRIAQRHGLTVELDRSGALLPAFYDVFARFAHQAGTPLFSRAFLENVVAVFPDGFHIVVVWQQKRPLAAYFQLEMAGTVYGMWGAALREFLPLRPVYLAYWEIMRYAGQCGYHTLDMGRSPAGSNAAKFKGQWGGTAHPVYQQIAHFGGQANGEANGRFQWVTDLWPWLPFPLAQFLGPKLRRHMPFA
ncbi:MAG: GNAT family N-acetyltransferase, partial [Anaerolineales bacterium]|nr:GNAT family N-acetyltransferase [Anaerolineales bacterium]